MSNSQIVRRIVADGWNREDFDFLDGATADRIPFHHHGETVEVTPGSLPDLVRLWRTAFPDLQMTIRHLIDRDDLVAVSVTLTGTHLGAWQGIAATHREVAVEEMMFFRFDGGILVEMWEVFDEAGLRHQLTAAGG